MISNMTKCNFPIYGVENFISLLPLIMHFTLPGRVEKMIFEPLATYICIITLYAYFYFHLFLISLQFLARNPDKNFWTIKSKNKSN